MYEAGYTDSIIKNLGCITLALRSQLYKTSSDGQLLQGQQPNIAFKKLFNMKTYYIRKCTTYLIKNTEFTVSFMNKRNPENCTILKLNRYANVYYRDSEYFSRKKTKFGRVEIDRLKTCLL